MQNEQQRDNQLKMAIVMMGLPGSGKSFWIASYIETLRKQPDSIDSLLPVVCSADHYYDEHPEANRHDPKNYPVAHAECLRKYIAAVQAGKPVICDNCNVTPHAMAPYVSIARAYGYEVRIIFCRTEDAFSRQQHEVPRVAHNHMRNQLNKLLAEWPGVWPEFGVVKT